MIMTKQLQLEPHSCICLLNISCSCSRICRCCTSPSIFRAELFAPVSCCIWSAVGNLARRLGSLKKFNNVAYRLNTTKPIFLKPMLTFWNVCYYIIRSKFDFKNLQNPILLLAQMEFCFWRFMPCFHLLLCNFLLIQYNVTHFCKSHMPEEIL